MYKDIIIIGGGASGIMCAIRAAECNKSKRILLLEKQSRIAKKLMSTGNGRCNLTNINANKSFYHGSFAKYADIVLNKVSSDRLIKIFNSYGLIERVDSEGRVYPYSNHASSVIDVLRLKLKELKIDVITDAKVNHITKKGNTFTVLTADEKYNCEKLIVCTGSKASPKLGADASGQDFLKNMGHKISPLSPALCAIPVQSTYLSTLKGVRSTGKVVLYSNNISLKEEFGEIQFTEKALSGICVFNLSSYLENNKNYEIGVSLLPDYNNKELEELLKIRRKAMGKYHIEELFTGIFVKPLALSILKESSIKPLSRLISTINDKEIYTLIKIINDRRFKVINKLSFESAQVVSGGVIGDEINPHTMESKIVKNLYICGEAIDIHGDCGGFNLQFAFASGIIAGENL